MKTQVLVRRATLFCSLLLVFAAGFAACGDETKSSSGNGGSGGASGTGGMGGTASSGGMGGMAMSDAGTSPFAAPCTELCGYLAGAGCQAWPNCQTECESGFNAPAACSDEFLAMVNCWAMNKMSFTCTMTQIIPPPACQPLEQAFNDCFSGTPPEMDAGTTGCQPQPGTCNKGADSCSCITNCAGTDLKWVCALPSGSPTWSCSCYSIDPVGGNQLLGTCTQQFEGCLNNAMGCCEIFFVQ